MNETKAIKEFHKLKHNPTIGAIMIRLRNAENMAMYEAEELIVKASVVISNIFCGDVYRLKYGDFLIFTEDCYTVADKINSFLYRLSDDKSKYAVGCEKFDEHEDEYNVFMKRIMRSVKLAEYSEGKVAIY